MSKSGIILWIFLPLLLVYFVFGVFFIPSWYNFQITVGLCVSIILLLIWIFRLRAYNKSGKQTAARIILSFWIFACLLASNFKLFSGQDGEWFSNIKLFQKKILKEEWTSKDKRISIYIFENTGFMTHSENVWLRKGRLPFMEKYGL